MRGARPDRVLLALVAAALAPYRGRAIVIGVSGGSDSIALAGLVSACDLDLRLSLVHVDHRVRASSAQDEAVACAAAARLDLPIECVSLRSTADDEAGLRALRYDAFIACASKQKAAAVLTGHHAQDQTETMLLALFRGTGRAGLMGMAQARQLTDEIELVRPLLRVDRESLQRYCERLHLPYVVDPTNVVLEYRRNAVRAALAALRPLFPGLDRAVARCAHILREEYSGESSATLRRMMYEALCAAGAGDDVTFERVDAAVRMLQLSQGRTVRIRQEEEYGARGYSASLEHRDR